MAKFKYVGDVGRVIFDGENRPAAFTVDGLDDGETRPPGCVEPGDVVEAGDNPHAQFFEAVTSKAAKAEKGD